MVRRQIDFDEETDQRLTDLAQDFGGDLSQELAELHRSRESVEHVLDQWEEASQGQLAAQRDRSEREFLEGRTTPGPTKLTKQKAACTIDLLVTHPRMCPNRRRGLMRGYRYFIADRYLFY